MLEEAVRFIQLLLLTDPAKPLPQKPGRPATDCFARLGHGKWKGLVEKVDQQQILVRFGSEWSFP